VKPEPARCHRAWQALAPSDILPCLADARPWSLSAHAGAVTCLAWHAGSGALTSGDAAGQVLAWAPGSGGWAKQLTHHR
jgi:hypothetical protein